MTLKYLWGRSIIGSPPRIQDDWHLTRFLTAYLLVKVLFIRKVESFKIFKFNIFLCLLEFCSALELATVIFSIALFL